LADEARNVPPIHWTVYRGDKKLGRAKTWIKYHEPDDTFELHELLELDLAIAGLVRVKSMSGVYRITREGQLREISGDLTLASVLPGIGIEAMAHVDGSVRDHQFTPHCRIESPLLDQEVDLPPVEIRANGSVLDPLHPVKRVLGLRRSQQWRMPVVNPVGDAVSAYLGRSNENRFLDAQVFPETKPLLWDGKEWPCLVIEYRGDDLTAHTWVRESDGSVLRQDATVWGDTLVFDRDWPHASQQNYRPPRLE
jgi:hypothetical protein